MATVYSLSDNQEHPILFTPGGSTDLSPTFPNTGGAQMWGTDGTQQVTYNGAPLYYDFSTFTRAGGWL